MPANLSTLLRIAQQQLSSSSTPRLDAELLFAHVLGWSRAKLIAERDHRPSEAQAEVFQAFVERRTQGEPIAYITGHKEFYGLQFAVDPRVLVPRPETEILVEHTLQAAQRLSAANPLRIVDIGTGSGAIAIALATHLPAAEIIAVDISSDALEVAKANINSHGLAQNITLLQGDLFAPLDAPVDLIVSNPPYTILSEIDANVREYEPWLALDGGEQGLEVYQRLLENAPTYLRPNGAILLEIGAWQGEAVAKLAATFFTNAHIRVLPDLTGRDRVVQIDTGLF